MLLLQEAFGAECVVSRRDCSRGQQNQTMATAAVYLSGQQPKDIQFIHASYVYLAIRDCGNGEL